MKPLLHLMPYRFWGGPEIQIFQLAAKLAEQCKIKTEIIAYTSPAVSKNDIRILSEKAKHYQIELGIRSSPKFSELPRERKFLATKIASGSYSTLVSTGYLCDLLAVKQKIKTISIVHGWTSQDLKVRIYEALNKRLLWFFDGVGCVSIAQQRELQVRGMNAFLIPNALDISQEKPLTRAEILQTLNLTDDVFLMTTIGRLSPEKGHEFALRAFQKILIQQPKVHWLLIGDGPEKNLLEKLAQKLQINSHVHFLGKKDFAWKWLSASDLFLLPSLREGLPVVLLEAFSQYTPTLSTEVGGVSQLVIDRKTGLLIPSEQEDAVISGVLWAINHPNEMNEMAQNAFQLLKTHFTVEAQVLAYQELLNDVHKN